MNLYKITTANEAELHVVADTFSSALFLFEKMAVVRVRKVEIVEADVLIDEDFVVQKHLRKSEK